MSVPTYDLCVCELVEAMFRQAPHGGWRVKLLGPKFALCFIEVPEPNDTTSLEQILIRTGAQGWIKPKWWLPFKMHENCPHHS